MCDVGKLTNYKSKIGYKVVDVDDDQAGESPATRYKSYFARSRIMKDGTAGRADVNTFKSFGYYNRLMDEKKLITSFADLKNAMTLAGGRRGVAVLKVRHLEEVYEGTTNQVCGGVSNTDAVHASPRIKIIRVMYETDLSGDVIVDYKNDEKKGAKQWAKK